ncbi:MAG TPA: 2-amino-4-hydroxy-6-hydroxymethyldihydropteridine diphosphokinase [Actinomycetes bacterium]|nr:2-amino-4-hydroxy-6-hydroxymethyldihydropteridine diphosphokinase [Actinomycetes bacterium]
MSGERAALSVGSNLGDRLAHLQAAVDALIRAPGVDVLAVSSVVETDPVGGPEQPDFLNAVVVVETSLAAEDLLTVTQSIEAAADRVRSEHWGPRTLDVDVLAVGSVTVFGERLTLPHPLAAERAFVLVPWAEVDPDFEVVGRGRVADLARVVGSGGVRATGLRLELR